MTTTIYYTYSTAYSTTSNMNVNTVISVTVILSKKYEC
jgi:fumarate hydratase class II